MHIFFSVFIKAIHRFFVKLFSNNLLLWKLLYCKIHVKLFNTVVVSGMYLFLKLCFSIRTSSLNRAVTKWHFQRSDCLKDVVFRTELYCLFFFVLENHGTCSCNYHHYLLNNPRKLFGMSSNAVSVIESVRDTTLLHLKVLFYIIYARIFFCTTHQVNYTLVLSQKYVLVILSWMNAGLSKIETKTIMYNFLFWGRNSLISPQCDN